MRSLKCLSAVIAVCSLLSLTLFHHAAAAPAAPWSVYVPFAVRGGGNTPTPPTPTPPTPTPPASADGALFLQPDQKIASPSIATDKQGGMHTAYHYYISEIEGGPQIVYSYCAPPATRCTSRDGWANVSLPVSVDEVQMQLTPDGHPRILGAHSSVGQSGGLFLTYIYAECNQQCLDAANWQTVNVTMARQGYMLEAREAPRRSFALDHDGHPHFVFNDNGSNQDDGTQRYGGYIYGCDNDCTVAQNWSATRFTHPDPNGARRGEAVDAPVLKFASANQPRILGAYYPLTSEYGHVTQIGYFACDNGCDDDANWQQAELTPRGNGAEPAWDLELDSQDRPRVVVYHEETTDDASKLLFYYECNTDCLSANAWQPVDLGLEQTIGRGADLALDAAGHPRIAHLVNHGTLAYSWCNAACDGAASWQHRVADKLETLDASDAVAIPPSCVKGGWSNYGPNFVLDSGNPRVVYNAVYYADCKNLPRPGLPPTSGYQEIAHRVRVFFTSQP